MIEDIATVIKVDGENVVVESVRKSACSGCGAKDGCGTNVLATLFDKTSENPRLTLKNTVGAKEGEKVVIGVDERVVIKSSFFVYIVPVLSMIFFASIGVIIAKHIGLTSDNSSMILGIFGLLLGFGWLFLYSKRLATEKQYQPVLLRIKHDCEKDG